LRGINLPDAPDVSGSCLLRYEVEAGVGGKIAQLGGRLINGVVSKTADQFFSNFVAAVKQ
jgi:carbon monoxide dehydrogenase subunit G